MPVHDALADRDASRHRGARMIVTGRAGVPPEVVERLGASHAAFRTLEQVLDWGRSQELPLAVADIVTQDEYTHDVLLPLDTRHWLVYDTT